MKSEVYFSIFHSTKPNKFVTKIEWKRYADTTGPTGGTNRITQNPTPLPSPAAAEPTNPNSNNSSNEADDDQFIDDPWILRPIHADYGVNIILGEGVFLNFNTTFVDTCPITIGARTLVGPNCSFYAGTHPLDPAIRRGTSGPELGSAISIGEDCWIGGNVVVLPGVSVGKGCTIGAGSVVTRDIPAFHVAVGNPARVVRKIETAMDPESSVSKGFVKQEETKGPEEAFAAAAVRD